MRDATLIDGALGFTGQNLVDYCLSKGDYVVATDLEQNIEKSSDIIRERGWTGQVMQRNMLLIPSDLTDKKSLDKMFWEASNHDFNITEAYRNAAVFDMSAGRDILEKVNVEGTENFCQVAGDHGVERVIYTSTASIYGHDHLGQKITEETGFERTGDYPETKYMGEVIHAMYNKPGLKCLISRPGLKYGPGSVYGAVILLAAVAQMGLILTVGSGDRLGKAATTYLHIDNDVAAMRHLMKSDLFTDRIPDPNEIAYNVADRYPEMGTTQEDIMLKTHEVFYGNSMLQRISRSLQAKIPKPRKLVDMMAAANDWARIKGILPPMLEPNAVDYYFSDHIFDTSKLESTGFRWPVPDTMDGIVDVLKWYDGRDWKGLPDLSFKGIGKHILRGLLRK